MAHKRAIPTELSNKQQHIVDLMKSGWQLGMSTAGLNRYSWIQKGGCGKGGETEDVHGNTVFALQDKGIIVVDHERFPLRTYKLKERKNESN